jgi:hypothetical protein
MVGMVALQRLETQLQKPLLVVEEELLGISPITAVVLVVTVVEALVHLTTAGSLQTEQTTLVVVVVVHVIQMITQPLIIAEQEAQESLSSDIKFKRYYVTFCKSKKWTGRFNKKSLSRIYSII